MGKESLNWESAGIGRQRPEGRVRTWCPKRSDRRGSLGIFHGGGTVIRDRDHIFLHEEVGSARNSEEAAEDWESVSSQLSL